MATYWLGSDAPRKYASYKWKAPLVFAAFIAIAIVCSRYEFFWEQRFPQFPDLPSLLLPIAVIGAIFSFGLIFVVHYALRNVATLRISVTPEGISRSGAGLNELFIPREEITGFTERKNAIVVRTADARRMIIMPAEMERYADFRSELVFMGITQISGASDQLWMWGPILISISIVLLVFTKPGQRSGYENVFVATSLLGLAWLFYAAWRNHRLKHEVWRLFPISTLIAIGITFAIARHSAPVWHNLLLGVSCLIGITLFVMRLFESRNRKRTNKN
jgi:hypothetical protein